MILVANKLHHWFKNENKKNSGADGICNENPIYCSQMVEEHHSTALHECFKIWIFPECLNIASVIALLEKGEQTDPENYRPISLLS